jgi:hypothetical protein
MQMSIELLNGPSPVARFVLPPIDFNRGFQN